MTEIRSRSPIDANHGTIDITDRTKDGWTKVIRDAVGDRDDASYMKQYIPQKKKKWIKQYGDFVFVFT